MQRLLKAAVLATILFIPCWSFAGSSNAVIAGSCNNIASGFCNEFTGSSYKAANAEKSCKKQKMIFLTGACPTDGLVGTCLMYKGKKNEAYYRYYAGFPGYGIKPKGGAVAAAESQCAGMKGEWIIN